MAKIDELELSEEVYGAICKQYGRPEFLVDGKENPVSKEQFSKNVIKSFLKEAFKMIKTGGIGE